MFRWCHPIFSYHYWILPEYTFSGFTIQKQPPRGVLRKRCSENMKQIYRRTPMPKCDFNKVALPFYWNHTLAWVFSCKFAAPSMELTLSRWGCLSTKKFSSRVRQRGELKWASQLKPSGQQIFSTMSRPESTLIRQD